MGAKWESSSYTARILGKEEAVCHGNRKNCTSCKCPREAHDVCHEEWVSVRSRLGLKGEEFSCPATFDPRGKGLAWAPPGLPAHKVEEYFSMLPEKSVPRLGTPGERYRDRQLAFQLPKQDLARAYCRHLNPKHASSADDFMAARNEIALDIGSVQEVLERDVDCGACHTPLKYGTLAVSASKLGLLYHPACFRCTECKELLVDLAYCVHDDTLFCERHYAEQLKPRCAACDEAPDGTIPDPAGSNGILPFHRGGQRSAHFYLIHNSRPPRD